MHIFIYSIIVALTFIFIISVIFAPVILAFILKVEKHEFPFIILCMILSWIAPKPFFSSAFIILSSLAVLAANKKQPLFKTKTLNNN